MKYFFREHQVNPLRPFDKAPPFFLPLPLCLVLVSRSRSCVCHCRSCVCVPAYVSRVCVPSRPVHLHGSGRHVSHRARSPRRNFLCWIQFPSASCINLLGTFRDRISRIPRSGYRGQGDWCRKMQFNCDPRPIQCSPPSTSPGLPALILKLATVIVRCLPHKESLLRNHRHASFFPTSSLSAPSNIAGSHSRFCGPLPNEEFLALAGKEKVSTNLHTIGIPYHSGNEKGRC
ncbi:hypothetical protein EDD85DRAFT_840864 [Armillaria nabsnona]|nr:hypothetical protein EDD85DRAFT_840864 [Armillaria nabsnona]